MAGLLVAAFVPDERIELRGFLADIVPDRTGLDRWDEWWFEVDIALFPAVAVMLHLTAKAGASSVRELHRRAELDLEITLVHPSSGR
jgi:hypothetical protein